MLDKITVIIVHYKTLKLTKAAFNSLRKFYPSIKIVIVNNGDDAESESFLADAAKLDGNLIVLSPDKNLHHGPGMDFAISKISTDWFLTFDSDSKLLKENLLEDMISLLNSDTYAVGEFIKMNELGFFAKEGEKSFNYVHPKCALFDRQKYLTLPPFIKHGSPCISNEIAAKDAGYELIDFPVNNYISHPGRGTVGIYGYKLGIKGKINLLRSEYIRKYLKLIFSR
jgi:molybdopterin-guanine dinucleotide biosynthesis protein A